MTKIYASMIIAAVAWCAAAKADLMQDYDTLMYWTRKNVEHARREKKLETLDEDIYSAISVSYTHLTLPTTPYV